MDSQLNQDFSHSVYCRNYENIKALLSAGADPNVYDYYGYTALVVSLGDLPIIRLLLNYGADPNIKGTNGWTALVWSIAVTDIDSDAHVRVLLDYGADPNVYDTNVLTPLVYAIANDKLDVVQTLLSRGADPNIMCDRTTALTMASQKSDTIVQMLLEYGANNYGRCSPSILSQEMQDYSNELDRTRWEYLTQLMKCWGTFEKGLICLILSY
jgi:ankyrin repeat protein